MIGCRKRVFDLQTHLSAGHAERALGNNMYGIWLEGFEPFLDLSLGKERQFDFWIGRQGHCVKAFAGMDDLELMTFFGQLGDHALHGADNSVYLGFPGVCHDHDAHALLLIAGQFRVPLLPS